MSHIATTGRKQREKDDWLCSTPLLSIQSGTQLMG